ncbi:MAG: DUF4147 domain-containing protein [Vicinamibacterales bacterium]
MVADAEVPLSSQPDISARLHHLRRDIQAIVAGALAGVAPDALIERAIAEHGDELRAGGAQEYCLIAAGKAADPMARSFLARAPGRCRAGVVVSPTAVATPVDGVEYFLGGHPVPTEGSVAGGRRALALASQVQAGGRLVVLVSGGASAAMAAPVDGVSLADKMQTTKALLRAGVAIDEINAVRKHLSAIKGGRLAAACPGLVVAWAISDIVGPVADDPAVIGSGPTVADPSTFAEALAVTTRVARTEPIPERALAYLAAGAAGGRPETPKPGDGRLRDSHFRVVGSRSHAVEAAAQVARARGYRVTVLEGAIVGEAREAARAYFDRVRRAALDRPEPQCVLSSGETTVTVTGSGRGGRNQEFALSLVDAFADESRVVALASVGTDGVDGPTDAAGAVVDVKTRERARTAGLAEPDAFLAANDAYAYFERTGDLLLTGPTGTNVADLQVFLLG